MGGGEREHKRMQKRKSAKVTEHYHSDDSASSYKDNESHMEMHPKETARLRMAPKEKQG